MRHSLLCAILLFLMISPAACSSEGGSVATQMVGGTNTPTSGGSATASVAPSVAVTATTGPSDDMTPAVPTPTRFVASTPLPTFVAAPEPTATTTEPAPSPTATLPPAGGPLRVEQWGYSQAEAYTEVSWGFLVSNQDRTSAVLDTAYVVTFMDDAGATIKVDEGYVDIILPGVEIGIGGSTFLPQDAIARSMRVDLRSGRAATLPIQPEIIVDDVTYFDRSLFPIATGVASVRFDRPVENIEIYAVGFDRNDEIIGGGYAYLPFVLPDQPTGVEVSIPSVGQPYRIELYPVITSATIHADEVARLNDDEPVVAVDEQGWGIVASSGEIGWGFLLHNPDARQAVEPVRYQVTAWAADGTVLATNAAEVAALLPGERLGIGGSVFAPDGTIPDRVDVQVLGRSLSDVNLDAGLLRVGDVQLVSDRFTPRASAIVTNELDVDLAGVEVFAVGYDADDRIIGGGFASIEMLDARGQAPVEVALAVGGEPARVELFATLSSTSQIP